MAIRVICPNCLLRLKFRDRQAGTRQRCRKCKTELTLPGEALPEAVASGPRARPPVIEMIVAAVLVVGAAIGGYHFVQWQKQRETVRTGLLGPETLEAPEVRKRGNNGPGIVPDLPDLLKVDQEFTLGRGKVRVTALATQDQTVVDRIRASVGRKFAVVTVDLSEVYPGPSFDTLSVKLVEPDGPAYRVFSVCARDEQGRAYEVARRQIDSRATTGKSVTLELYFETPQELDPAKCRLVYE